MTGMRGSRFGSPAESPGFLLWRATLRWQRAVTEALRPLGVTHVQFVLLAVLVWRTRDPGVDGPTQRELADAAATDVMMTSQVVRTLEQRGLLERRPHRTDRRARQLVPTAAGREIVAQAIVAVEAVDSSFFPEPDAAVRALRPLADLQEDHRA